MRVTQATAGLGTVWVSLERMWMVGMDARDGFARGKRNGGIFAGEVPVRATPRPPCAGRPCRAAFRTCASRSRRRSG